VSAELKSCCAAVYSSETVRWLLGDSFHPGGAELTSRLARALEVGPGDTIVDVACGIGTSSLQIASETGCDFVGVDLSKENVAEARRASRGRGHFVHGDAEALPFDDQTFDGALCECSFCLFPDPRSAAAEIGRVLRPGARLAVSDVVADPSRLPGELTTVLGHVACVAAARPLEDLELLLEDAGLKVEESEHHDDALTELVDRISDRLRPLGSLPLLSAAHAAIEDGALGYGVLVARKP
jgi:hypothetical protein